MSDFSFYIPQGVVIETEHMAPLALNPVTQSLVPVKSNVYYRTVEGRLVCATGEGDLPETKWAIEISGTGHIPPPVMSLERKPLLIWSLYPLTEAVSASSPEEITLSRPHIPNHLFSISREGHVRPIPEESYDSEDDSIRLPSETAWVRYQPKFFVYLNGVKMSVGQNDEPGWNLCFEEI